MRCPRWPRDARRRVHYPAAGDRPAPDPPARPCAPRPPRARSPAAPGCCPPRHLAVSRLRPASGSWVRGFSGCARVGSGASSGRIPTPHALAAARSAPGAGRSRVPAADRPAPHTPWTVRSASRTLGGPIEIPIPIPYSGLKFLFRIPRRLGRPIPAADAGCSGGSPCHAARTECQCDGGAPPRPRPVEPVREQPVRAHRRTLVGRGVKAPRTGVCRDQRYRADPVQFLEHLWIEGRP